MVNKDELPIITECKYIAIIVCLNGASNSFL